MNGVCGPTTNAGEFVAPEKLECIYQECAIVDQVFVYGTPLKEYLTAVVVRRSHLPPSVTT
jgi:long-subunit acyl-CoA synthetase (AMP-forming)